MKIKCGLYPAFNGRLQVGVELHSMVPVDPGSLAPPTLSMISRRPLQADSYSSSPLTVLSLPLLCLRGSDPSIHPRSSDPVTLDLLGLHD